jgi:hypothetical protein
MHRKLPSFFSQLLLLTKRAILQLTRNTYQLCTLYGMAALAGCLIGGLYYHSVFVGPPPLDSIAKCPQEFQFLCAQNQQDTYMVQGLLVCLALGLTAGSASLYTFGGTEKLLFERERRTGQSNLAYGIAKLISAFPHQVLAPLLFISLFQVNDIYIVFTSRSRLYWRYYRNIVAHDL